MNVNQPIKILYITGGDSKYHDFKLAGQIYRDFLSQAGFEVTVSEDLDLLLPESIVNYDVIMLYSINQYLSPDHEKSLLAAVIGNPWGNTGKPKGFIGLHSATITFSNSIAFQHMVGARFLTHPPIGSFSYQVEDKNHPVTAGLSDFELTSELYVVEELTPFQPLLTSFHKGFKRPVAWVKPYGLGRVFISCLGHTPEEMKDPGCQSMIVNAVKWSVSEL